MKNWDIDTDKISFLGRSETEKEEQVIKDTYKVIIADDDDEVHKITKMLLGDFTFNSRKLEFIDTYSGSETMEVLASRDDIAILFLDVVMEKKNSGFEVVEYLRNDLHNYMTRVILRTGQPDEAPQEKVIEKYDINDYRLKTELTVKRLYTSVYTAVRSYRDLSKLQSHKAGLEKIIRASANLFNKDSLNDFLVSVLQELASFHDQSRGVVYLRQDQVSNGLVSVTRDNRNYIIAATGSYEMYIGREMDEVPELSHVLRYLNGPMDDEMGFVRKIENGFLVIGKDNMHSTNYIFIEGEHQRFDFDLLNLFLSNFSVTLDNFILNNMLKDTQREIVFALAETVESHFEETGNHIKRISSMMYEFALLHRMSYQEAEMLRLASTMHDLGKIAIPDAILKKPGKLTAAEFDIIKTHTVHGYKILNGSDLPILQMAAGIALNHHEKYDGSGYPGGKKDSAIPLSARMMAIVDVFDALTHKRVYKDAYSREDAINMVMEGRGTHFDPYLLDLFMANLDGILKNAGN